MAATTSSNRPRRGCFPQVTARGHLCELAELRLAGLRTVPVRQCRSANACGAPRSIFQFRECFFHDKRCPRGGTQPPRIGRPGLDSLKCSVWMLPPLPWSPGLIPLTPPTNCGRDSVNVIKGGDRVLLPGVVLPAPSRNSFNGSAKGSARYTVNWR